MIAAIFDVDRTLLPDTTAERLFTRYLLARRELGLIDLMRTVWFVLRRLPTDSNAIHQVRRHRPYLQGKELARLEELGGACFDDVIRPRLTKMGLARVAEHHASGHHTILLSGSLPFLLTPMAESLGVDRVIGSKMAMRGTRLLGKLEGLHPYGRDKLHLVEAYAIANDLALPESFAYADHHSDEHLLESVGHPVAVNPSPRLRDIAARRGWPVEQWA